jgi:ABC-type nitrate/sulfonate/bicarbonate transport system substrate-binding protein
MSLFMFRKIIGTITGAVILASAVAAVPAGAQQANEDVKFGLLPGLALYLPLWVADDKGFFAEEKIQPNYISISGGGAQTMAALLGGSIDMTDLSLQAVAMANEKGQDLRLIAGNHTNLAYGFVVRSDLPEPVAADGYPAAMHKLRGKRVAASTIGSNSYIVLKHMLEGAGMTFDDVVMTQVQTGSSVLAMMSADLLDASIQTEPNILLLTEKLKKGRLVLDLRDPEQAKSMGLDGLTYDIWVAKASVAREDRIIRATRALDKAISFVQEPGTDITYLMELARKNLNLDMSDDLLKHLVSSMIPGFRTVITREDVRRGLEILGIKDQPYESVVSGLAMEQ